MLKKRVGTIIRFILFLGIIIVLAVSGLSEKAYAEVTTCTWEGTVDTSWYNVSNWSGCYFNDVESYPINVHDVIIPDTAPRFPVLDKTDISVNTLTIDSDAQLSITGYYTTSIRATSFVNNGLIEVIEPSGLAIKSPFYNNYQVNFSYRTLYLLEGGTHAGSFTGDTLRFNTNATEQIHTFQNSSSISVNSIYVTQKHIINFYGPVDTDSLTIETGSIVQVFESASVDLGEVTLKGGELIAPTHSVSSGDTLSGTGTIEANLTNAGTVSPGNSPGTITVDGNYTQESTGSLAIELGGTTPDTEHDQVVVTGAVILGGTLDVSLINEFSPQLGDSFTIMTYGSITGTFASTSLPTLDPGLKWGVSLGETTMRLIVEADGGSISGEVTYTGDEGNNPISVGLFLNPNDAPVATDEVSSGTGIYSYSFVGIPDGTYYIGALMDLNGNHQPDPGEPFDWYGAPDSLVISSVTSDYTDIDFQLNDPFMIFLPLLLK